MLGSLVDGRKNAADGLREDENKSRVVRFYKGRRHPREDGSTFRGRLQGLLSLHIQSILAFATIKELELDDVEDDALCGELAKALNQSRSGVERLHVESEVFRQSHLDVITAGNPRMLRVSKASQLPDKFYQLPVVMRLTELRDGSEAKTVSNLSLLSARTIEINGRHNVTIDDVWQILRQWAESKREIAYVHLDFNEMLTMQKCIELVDEHLDSNLIRAKPARYRDRQWLLTRSSDAATVTFWALSSHLHISS